MFALWQRAIALCHFSQHMLNRNVHGGDVKIFHWKQRDVSNGVAQFHGRWLEVRHLTQ